MKRFVVGIMAAAVLVSMAHTAMAQSQDRQVRDENGDGHRRGDRSRDPHGHAQESRTVPS